jgi:hypothetical protein
MKEFLEYVVIIVVMVSGLIPLVGILVDQLKQSKNLGKR